MAIFELTPQPGLYENYLQDWLDCNNPEFDLDVIAKNIETCNDKHLQIFLKNSVFQTDKDGANYQDILDFIKNLLGTFQKSEIFDKALKAKYNTVIIDKNKLQ